ncbi:MAG: hypothetical protein JW843_11000 [Candidatus Aminicenantes bacterium]|nr:hypothetical protein [Candidatus Aminicenantes bacterium]
MTRSRYFIPVLPAVFLGTAAALWALAAVSPPQGEAMLVGPQPKAKITQAVPDWTRLAKSYEPNDRVVIGLQNFEKSARIRVFVGTWDAKGKSVVAALIKTLETAQNPMISVDWIGVSRDLKEPAADLKSYGVRKVPTIIVWVDGEERGRIVEVPQQTVEEDLAGLLLDIPAPDADMEYFRITPHSHLPIDCTPCHIPSRRSP